MLKDLQQKFLEEKPLSEREILLLILNEIVDLNNKLNSIVKKK